jgi:predicted PP-loop superfamily ATPase
MSATKKPRTDSGEKPKVVLAYSGGLDTSVILVWLIEKVSDGGRIGNKLLLERSLLRGECGRATT